MYLFFDTETTGFPNPNIDALDPEQGRVCQLAMILADEEGRTVAEFSSLIAPHFWSITEGAQKIHGHDDAKCEKYGIESRKAFLMFLQFARRAKVLVAHNLDFDWRVLQIEADAHILLLPEKLKLFCTMKEATDVCKIPGKRGGYKWPKLEEALPILCNYKLEGAHDAMADTKGCRDVFFALKDRELLKGLV